MKLTLVIPCYNEEENVDKMYAAIEEAFLGKEMDLELVYVNDGSRDNTLQKLKGLLSKSDFQIKIVDFSRNFGKEAAIYAGLKQSTGDYTALIDGDLQQPPALVAEMVAFLEAHPDYDCVATYQDKRGEGAVLKFFKNMFYKVINKVTDVTFVNGASDFRTFRRNMLETILSMSEGDRFTKGIFAWVGFRTHFIPYVAAERTAGVSKWSFRKLFKYAMGGIMSFSSVPLSFAKYAGGLSVLSAFVYLLVVLIRQWMRPMDPVIIMILLMGGLNLIALAVLGSYVGKIFFEAKKRPIYIAREVLSNDKKTKN